jgi:hypothetical protein
VTFRLTFGIDPGLTGAVATLVDGVPDRVFDMPLIVTPSGNGEIDGARLAAWIRGVRQLHRGAYVSACIEQVGAMGRKDKPRQGSTSIFRFGESSGKPKGILEALGIPYSRAIPVVWKRHFKLLKCEKDDARLLAITKFPHLADELKRKKDGGRADAVLLALWHEETEQAPKLGQVA